MTQKQNTENNVTFVFTHLRIKLKSKNRINVDKFIKDDHKKANIFQSSFKNSESSLKISYKESLPLNRDTSGIVEHAIKNFENYSSIVAIKNKKSK